LLRGVATHSHKKKLYSQKLQEIRKTNPKITETTKDKSYSAANGFNTHNGKPEYLKHFINTDKMVKEGKGHAREKKRRNSSNPKRGMHKFSKNPTVTPKF